MKKLLVCLLGIIALTGCTLNEELQNEMLTTNEVLGVSSVLSSTSAQSKAVAMSNEVQEDLLEQNIESFNSYLTTFEALLDNDSIKVEVQENVTYDNVDYQFSLKTTLNIMESNSPEYTLYYNEIESNSRIPTGEFASGNSKSKLEGIAVIGDEVKSFEALKLTIEVEGKTLDAMSYEIFDEISTIKVSQNYSTTDGGVKQMFSIQKYLEEQLIEKTSFVINQSSETENTSIKMMIFEGVNKSIFNIIKVVDGDSYTFQIGYASNGTPLKCTVTIIENEDCTTSYNYELNGKNINMNRHPMKPSKENLDEDLNDQIV